MAHIRADVTARTAQPTWAPYAPSMYTCPPFSCSTIWQISLIFSSNTMRSGYVTIKADSLARCSSALRRSFRHHIAIVIAGHHHNPVCCAIAALEPDRAVGNQNEADIALILAAGVVISSDGQQPGVLPCEPALLQRRGGKTGNPASQPSSRSNII
ncbi:MAG: hypothetical protein U0401_25200 [Anaerolineae bacterium]